MKQVIPNISINPEKLSKSKITGKTTEARNTAAKLIEAGESSIFILSYYITCPTL